MPTVTRNRQPIPEYDVYVEGELVMLKSGGPVMTTIGFCEDCNEVEVAYGTSDGDIDILGFPPEALVRVS